MKWTRTSRRILAVCLLSMAWIVGTASAVDIPDLWGRVMDNAGMLSPGAVERLESRLTRLEQDTGAQVVVLTVPSLEGLPVEDFSMQAVEKWRLGREEADDGVLILIAKRDRKMRIEVGYGLEGSLPDITAGRIISELMAPYFRQGHFDAGIEAAVTAVDGKIRGEAVSLEGPPTSSGSNAGDDGPFVFMMFVLFGGLPMMRDTVIAKSSSAWVGYAVIAGLTFALYGIVRLTLLLVLGALWLIAFPILRFTVPESTRRELRKQRRRRGRSTWIGGGGGGFSGGGFSGGGGSFGGGGASGSW